MYTCVGHCYYLRFELAWTALTKLLLNSLQMEFYTMELAIALSHLHQYEHSHARSARTRNSHTTKDCDIHHSIFTHETHVNPHSHTTIAYDFTPKPPPQNSFLRFHTSNSSAPPHRAKITFRDLIW